VSTPQTASPPAPAAPEEAGARWALAAAIDERLPLPPSIEPDTTRAERRLAMWMDVGAFRGIAGRPDRVDERLRPLGINARQLTALLGERRGSVERRLAQAPWYHRISAASTRILTGHGAATPRGLPNEPRFLQ